jgi:hypothetical protein
VVTFPRCLLLKSPKRANSTQRRARQARVIEQEVGMKRVLRVLAAAGALSVALFTADAAFAQKYTTLIEENDPFQNFPYPR